MAKARMSKRDAEGLVRALWAGEGDIPVNEEWQAKVEQLSRLCVGKLGKTHIAMLGTAILAKAVNLDVDLLAFKPKHADPAAKSYSARTLCHGVLVPLAAELGFHIGATGREPLNNQPYFRMRTLDDGTPVHEESRAAYDYMMSLIRELQVITSSAVLSGILRAFLTVRMHYQPKYASAAGTVSLSPLDFVEVVRSFVQENSERGACAQAVVAGLFDVFAGPENVVSGRIHDPSRDYPGDVCVRGGAVGGRETWVKAIEVRDKPVSEGEVFIFGKRCADSGVREGAVVMVGADQPRLDVARVSRWAETYGIGMTLFHGWREIVDQALYWSEEPKPEGVAMAVRRIHKRLIGIEVSEEGVERWVRLAMRGMSGTKTPEPFTPLAFPAG